MKLCEGEIDIRRADASSQNIRSWLHKKVSTLRLMPHSPQCFSLLLTPPRFVFHLFFRMVGLIMSCSTCKYWLLVVDLPEVTRRQHLQERALMSRFSRLQNSQGLSENLYFFRNSLAADKATE